MQAARSWAGACLSAVAILAGASLARAADESFGIPQVRFINEQVAASWADTALKPSGDATDAEWCRRVFLDTIGRIPTVDELKRFLADSSPTRKADLASRLLGEEYADEYARNWTDVWTTILIGRDTENRFVSRSGMRQWLRRSFQKNKPYDRFVEELVTAEGSNTNKEGIANFNGATNFLTGKLEEGGVQAAAKTAQIFLGLQVQCTQCHDHPINTGKKQNQFWEFNSFFRQARALRRFEKTMDIQSIELVDEDFAGEGGNPQAAEVFYELRNGLKKAAFPVFVDGTAIDKSGYLPGVMQNGRKFGVHRRKELAQLIKASPLMPKVIVNRMWGHFLGYGFTKPVDDLGEHNPPSHPELLDGLAAKFGEQSYDLKELIRWIVLSKPYSLSSRIGGDNTRDDPTLGEPPRFSRFYLRQMRAEELYESLLTATAADESRTIGERAARKKDEWLGQFVIAFGTDEGDDTTMFNGSITQVLTMFNSELMKVATGAGKGGFLDRVAAGNAKNAAKIETLYLAALARKPSKPEVAMANQLMKARQGDAVGALQDIWWAVLNSNEFILNH